jgi:hypothetical protein
MYTVYFIYITNLFAVKRFKYQNLIFSIVFISKGEILDWVPQKSTMKVN